MTRHRGSASTALCALLTIGAWACAERAPTSLDGLGPAFDFTGPGDVRVGDGLLEQEQFELCKNGMDATFTVDVVNHKTDGTRETLSYDVDVTDGQCLIVWESGGPGVDTVTVTEHVPAGYSATWELTQLSSGVTTTYTGVGPMAQGFVNGLNSGGGVTNAGVLAVFTNTPVPMDGRMTGGGVIRLNGYVDGQLVDVTFTHGFTLHCDILLSNNLEVNWGGSQWHIEKESLENVFCIDDPAVSPEPPAAPFDTFIANAWGRLNGVWGSYIAFTLVDSGEPGGKNDKAGLSIWAVGADPSVDPPVVYVPLDYKVSGNIQAHYDQPHK